MNTFSITVFVIILLFVQEHFCNTGDDVGDFFKSIPGGIKSLGKKTGNTFDSVWKSIKKPFSIRRLGRGGRRRRRRTTSSTTSEPLPTECRTTSPFFRRVAVPVLPTPVWRGIDHWNLIQLPRYALTEGINYEFRRRQISKWAEKFVGLRPTRITISSTMSSSPSDIYEVAQPIRRKWFPVIPNTDMIKEDNVYRPIDYYALA